MKFSYTALSSDNKQVNGVLTAENIDAAKESLHQMGLSILSVDEISEEEYERRKKQEASEKAAKGIVTFDFKAIDNNGKTVEGSIDATEPYIAYKRLVNEYEFNVQELYPQGASETKKQAALSILPDLKKKLETESGTKEEQKDDDSYEKAVKLDEELIAEIDKLIGEAKDVTEKHKNLFSNDRFADIQSKLDELQRIRTSNNIKHITEVAKRLFELIQEPDDVSQDESEQSNQMRQSLGKLDENKVLQKDVSLYQKSVALSKVFDLFNQVKGQLRKLSGKKPTKDGEKPQKSAGLGKLLGKFKKDSPEETAKRPKESRLTAFFIELSSFVGWLLAFYIIYFFLVDFSLEKSIGLPPEFVLSTLRSPLIVNITIFLVITHLLLRIKNRHFVQNFLGSLFLFFFGYGVYALVILNA